MCGKAVDYKLRSFRFREAQEFRSEPLRHSKHRGFDDPLRCRALASRHGARHRLREFGRDIERLSELPARKTPDLYVCALGDDEERSVAFIKRKGLAHKVARLGLP